MNNICIKYKWKIIESKKNIKLILFLEKTILTHLIKYKEIKLKKLFKLKLKKIRIN